MARELARAEAAAQLHTGVVGGRDGRDDLLQFAGFHGDSFKPQLAGRAQAPGFRRAHE